MHDDPTTQRRAAPGPRYGADAFPPPRPIEPLRRGSWRREAPGTRRYLRTSRSRRRAARVRKAIRVAAFAVVLVFAIVQACHAVTGGGTGFPSGPMQAYSSASPTPKEDWRMGAVPYLYQTDGTWADVPYAEDTVRASGCGPTCLSMAAIALTGKTQLDPGQVARFSEEHGYVEDGMTSWRLFTQGAPELGLQVRELPGQQGTVEDALAQGGVVVASVRPGDFTTQGHFIVVAGVRDDGLWEVHDPNSEERSAQGWDPQRVLGQCRVLWSLTT